MLIIIIVRWPKINEKIFLSLKNLQYLNMYADIDMLDIPLPLKKIKEEI